MGSPEIQRRAVYVFDIVNMIRYCEHMANFTQHAICGALAGTVTYLVWSGINGQPLTFSGLLVSSAAGTLGGVLPDLLEPATHPHHRAFFHSLAFAASAGIGVQRFASDPSRAPAQKLLVLVAALGYASHLTLDGCTPRGLPAVC
jgi:inner membrane protein